MELNIEEIQEIIPHRPPFLLVDRITDFVPGAWAKGIKAVTVNEPFFMGHFPQYRVMPGVLIIEALAQVGAVAILSLPENKGKLAFFGGIKNARCLADRSDQAHGSADAGCDHRLRADHGLMPAQ